MIIYGDWGLGIGDWGLGIGPNPQSQSPIPNPQSPLVILNYHYILIYKINCLIILKIFFIKIKPNIYNIYLFLLF